MANLKGIKLNIGLDSVSSVSVISRNTVSYSISCNNAGTQTLNVSCPINQDHRNINTAYEISSPYSDLALSGYSTEIDLIKNQNYTVSKTTLSGPPNDASVAVNIDAEWLLTNNTPNSYTLTSEKIPNYNNIMLPLGPDTCVSVSITDTIYQLKFTFNTNVVLTPINSGDNAYQALDNITTRSITGSSTSASYTSTLDVKVNYIWLNITSMGIIPCGGSAPTPAPVPGVNNAMSRYGIVTDPITKQNSLGLYYGLNTSQATQVFDYSNIDKYKLLIKRDDCFKILIVFILPVFPIFIPIPTWINVEIVNKVTQAITQAVTTAQGTFNQALTIALEVKDQINVKNAAVLATRGAAIAKVVASGQANDILAQAAMNYIQKQLEVVQSDRNYVNIAEDIHKIKNLIEGINNIIDSFSELQPFVDKLTGKTSGGSNIDMDTMLSMSQKMFDMINTAIKQVLLLLDSLPDIPLTRKIKVTVTDVRTLWNIFQNLLKSQKAKIIQTILYSTKTSTQDKIIEFLKILILEFLDPAFIRQTLKVLRDINDVSSMYRLSLENFDQLGVIKTAAELDERASQQQKSQLEQQAAALAQESAGAVDDTIGQVAEALHLKDLENLALQGIKEADKLLTADRKSVV